MTLADRARNSLKSVGVDDQNARAYTVLVLKEITNPDPEMIEAGMQELNLAMGKPGKDERSYRKLLAVAVYQAMLARVGA
jgi:hypothetical protein